MGVCNTGGDNIINVGETFFSICCAKVRTKVRKPSPDAESAVATEVPKNFSVSVASLRLVYT
jgi:hypothetical protein